MNSGPPDKQHETISQNGSMHMMRNGIQSLTEIHRILHEDGSVQEMLHKVSAVLAKSLHDSGPIAVSIDVDGNEYKTSSFQNNSLSDLHSKILVHGTIRGHIVIQKQKSSSSYLPEEQLLSDTAAEALALYLIRISQREKIVSENIKFRNYMHNAHDMLYRMTLPHGAYDFISPSAETITGYPPEIWYDNPMFIKKIVHPDWVHYFEKQWTNLKNGRCPDEYEFKITHKDGTERWINQRNSLIINDNGIPVAVEGVVTDISKKKQSEILLQENEEKHRLLFEKMMNGFILCQIIKDSSLKPVDLHILEANRAAHQLTGLEQDKMAKKRITEVLPDITHDPDSWLKRLLTVAETKQDERFNLSSKTTDKWFSFLAYCPEENQLAVLFEDISHRKRAYEELMRVYDSLEEKIEDGTEELKTINMQLEQEISIRKLSETAFRESEIRYRELFNRMSSAVAVCCSDDGGSFFIIQDVNSAAERIMKISKEKAIGKKLEDALPQLKGSGLLNVFREVWETEIPKYYPVTSFVEDRIEYWADNYVYKLPTGEIVAVFDDITIRKQAEETLQHAKEELEKRVYERTIDLQEAFEALRKSEAFNQSIIENSPDSILVLDSEGKIQFISHCGKFLMGSKFKYINTDFFSMWDNETDQAFNSFQYAGKGSLGHFQGFRPDDEGNQHCWDVYITKIKTLYNLPTRYLVVARNITEQKNLEIELQKSKEKAESANIAKSEFLANMSHEIRTPMNGIIGMSELLLDSELPYHKKRYVNRIHESAINLMDIINEILDFSKIEAGKIEINNTPFNLKEIIDSVIYLYETRAKQKDITLAASIPAEFPHLYYGDPVRIRQILNNLTSNAIKFTGNGEVMITVSIKKETQDNAEVTIAVVDTGVGIKEEKISEIFDKFTQQDSSTTRKYGGTGLGLAISKNLAELMGGQISVRSSYGKGSTFWLTIPLQILQKVHVEHAQQEPPEMRFAAIENKIKSNASGKYRVLLAEDNEINQEIAYEFLNNLGYNVDIAVNGLEAVKLFQKNTYSIVFMDWQMPEMDGIQATEKIRSMEKGKTVPIIAMTARVLETDHEQCLSAGMDDFLEKPFSKEKFYTITQKYLSK